MLNLNSLLLGSDNPKRLVDFYKKVIKKDPDWGEGDWAGFQIGSCFLTIGSHDKVKGKAKDPHRILINFETKDVKGEFDRIKDLGAEVIAKPYQMENSWIATFADPDGNFFQLMSPWESN